MEAQHEEKEAHLTPEPQATSLTHQRRLHPRRLCRNGPVFASRQRERRNEGRRPQRHGGRRDLRLNTTRQINVFAWGTSEILSVCLKNKSCLCYDFHD